MARDTKKGHAHLDEGQVIMAVIDKEGLSPEVKAHIDTCAGCRARVEALEGELQRLGDMALEQVPSRWKRPSLKGARVASNRPRTWTIALAAGLAVAMLVFSLARFYSPLTPQPSQAAISSEMEQDARLSSEVGVLLSDPVPEPFEEISDVPGADAYEEFVDFVVPG